MADIDARSVDPFGHVLRLSVLYVYKYILNELLSYPKDKYGSSYTTQKLFKQYKDIFIFSYLSVEK